MNLPGFSAADSISVYNAYYGKSLADPQAKIMPSQLGGCCQDCDRILDEHYQCLQSTEDPHDCVYLARAYSQCMRFCEWCLEEP
jgi:hypothetical protein